jgi:hypothetical protein
MFALAVSNKSKDQGRKSEKQDPQPTNRGTDAVGRAIAADLGP